MRYIRTIKIYEDTMTITIHDDFDLYKIAYSGQCFRVKELAPDTFSFVTGNYRVTITDLGNSEYEISCSEDEWNNIWFHYFDLETNYSSIRATIPSSDIYLSQAANIGAGIRILNQDKFEMLISFIISQRKSIPAIKTSVEKLCALYGENGYFPTPKAMLNAADDELASCGLGYRVPYIKEAVRAIALCEIDLDELSQLSDDELFDALKSFYGVGDKVANCVALFAYHRIGRAPIDTWISKVIDVQYNGVNPFPKYGEVAGIMQQYMFYAAQHMKNLDSKH